MTTDRNCAIDFSPFVHKFADDMSRFKCMRNLVRLSFYATNFKREPQRQWGPITLYDSYTSARDEIAKWMGGWAGKCVQEIYQIATGAIKAYAPVGAPDWSDKVMHELEKDFGTQWPYRDKPRDGGESGVINRTWMKKVFNGEAMRKINQAALSDGCARFDRWALLFLKCGNYDDGLDKYLDGWVDGLLPPQIQIPTDFDPRGEVAAPPPALLEAMAIAENWNGQFRSDTDTGFRSWPRFGEEEFMQLRGESRSCSKWNYYVLVGHLYPRDLQYGELGNMASGDEEVQVIELIFDRAGKVNATRRGDVYTGEPGEELEDVEEREEMFHQSIEDAETVAKSNGARAAELAHLKKTIQTNPASSTTVKLPLHQQQGKSDNTTVLLIASAAAIAAIAIAYN